MGQHRFIAERVTRAQIEQIAQDYLERYQPECVGYEVKPVNVVRLLDTDLWTEKRVGFHPVDSLPDPVEGWFDFLKARVELTFVDLEGIEKGDRELRVLAAHEGAHGLLHSHTIESQRMTLNKTRRDLDSEEDPEWQADTLARAILMPSGRVLQAYDEWVTEEMPLASDFIVWLANVFEVTREVAGERINDLTALRVLDPRAIRAKGG